MMPRAVYEPTTPGSAPGANATLTLPPIIDPGHRLKVISSGMVCRPSVSDRAPNPHLPPPVSSAVRRDLFGGFASMLLLVPTEAGIAKAEELDRELLACCAEAEASERAATVTMDVVEAMDANDPDMTSALLAAYPVFVAYSDAIERAAQLPARSPEGLRAKASLLLLHIRTEQDHTALAASLARDVTGRAGV